MKPWPKDAPRLDWILKDLIRKERGHDLRHRHYPGIVYYKRNAMVTHLAAGLLELDPLDWQGWHKAALEYMDYYEKTYPEHSFSKSLPFFANGERRTNALIEDARQYAMHRGMIK